MLPKLYIFTISHFCEKARWALDYYGIEYELCILSPGAHRFKARKMGAQYSSLPVLDTGERVVQGSSEIVDWASNANKRPEKSLEVAPEWRDDAQQMEQRLDKRVGVHLRRMFYSEALVEHPNTVKPVFMEGLTVAQGVGLSLLWPGVRKLMIKGMDLGYAQGLESQAILDSELEWLNTQLADGRQYLIGGTFSRVDLTAASLLARTVLPKQHPGEVDVQQPPRMQQQAKLWRKGKTLDWVERIYALHR